MEVESKQLALRWATFISTAISFGFVVLSQLVLFPEQLDELNYRNAFYMQGLVSLLFFMYAVYQILPNQQHKLLYNRLAGPLIFTNIVTIIWVVLSASQITALSFVTVFMLFINALVMLSLVRRRILDCSYNPWLTLPFSVSAGWLSVVVAANFIYLIKTMGWVAGMTGGNLWVVPMVIVGFGFGIITGIKYKDPIYAAVVGVTVISLGVLQHSKNSILSFTVFTTGALLILWAIGYGIREQLVSSRSDAS